jgi:glycosyltransferase involved in cell wall biosynthesis
MKKKKYKISILITNYNKEKFLYKSLNSVVSQNYKNYEIILFDDESTDKSLDIINRYKKIRLIKNLHKNKEKTGAANQITGILQAFKKSKGQIICLMDSDDLFVKNKLNIINDFFQKQNHFNCVFNFPKTNKKLFEFKNKNNASSIWPTIFPTSCISVRRSFFTIFAKHIKKDKFPNLEVDARLTIFSNFFFNEYNLIYKKLTLYSFDPKGITSNINKFSKIWWIRRREAYIYLRYIFSKKNKTFNFGFDYYLTLFFSTIFKIKT